MKTLEFTTEQRRQLVAKANARQIFLRVSGKDYPAQLAGTHLEFPFIRTKGQAFHGVDLEAEINWHQAKRLAEGTSKHILFN